MSIINLSIEQLKQAISIKEEIAILEQKLAAFLNGKSLPVISPEAAVEAPAKRGRKKMSAAAKAKIAAAATARWAKIKGTASAPVAAKAAAKPVKAAKQGKRVLSPEGRARIVAALKKRWAAKKK